MTQNNPTNTTKHIFSRIEPPFWWADMHSNLLQLMIYGDDISSFQVKVSSDDVTLQEIKQVENPNYLFVSLKISPQAASKHFPIEFYKNEKLIGIHQYPLLTREKDAPLRKGFDSSDAIYLIMPDRFANGNPEADQVEGMLEQVNRKKPYGRHGGDLKGILDHLDYIQNLGFTAIWLTPVLENNQPHSSYHGYAITDFYKVDARLGSNEDFKNLTEECNKRGIKMIMDMVFNHCGNHHWWMNDLPQQDWINHWETFTRSNYRLSTISDPYVSEIDKKQSVKGWFDTHMPDLNLENELLLNYLIQNSIWWIEYAGLKGIRMDTYPYPDQHGMAIWAQRILQEYPFFNIVGEAWINDASKLCYWQKNFPNKDGFNSYLPSIIDFPMQEAIKMAFNEEEGWNTGMCRLYNTLADDHLYPDPMNLVIFPDNHDEGRILHAFHNDIRKLKMALAYAATTRGILQIYYGTELLMNGNGLDGHAHIRLDFPGGWSDDPVNAFSSKGRNKQQNEVYNYLKKLLTFRKNSNALKYGKNKHFIPENDVYVYFRYIETEVVMIVLNNNLKRRIRLETTRFKEVLENYKEGINILSGRKINFDSFLTINAKTAIIIELSKNA